LSFFSSAYFVVSWPIKVIIPGFRFFSSNLVASYLVKTCDLFSHYYESEVHICLVFFQFRKRIAESGSTGDDVPAPEQETAKNIMQPEQLPEYPWPKGPKKKSFNCLLT